MTDSIDWKAWLDRWDKQQERYLPDREERFTVMFDVLQARLGTEFTALDMGCGPGSLSDRLIDRFPDVNVYAIDIDPMLLKLGKNSVGTRDGRITWIEADLRTEQWTEALDIDEVEAVVSTTALHWLPPHDLLKLYDILGEMVSEGGIFLNGEGIDYSPHQKKFAEIVEGVKEIRKERRQQQGGEEWDVWWENFEEAFRANDLGKLVKAREERFHWKDHTEHRNVSFPLQRSSLLEAGFVEVDVIWQNLTNRVLMAVK